MLVVMPFYSGDAELLMTLLTWMGRLRDRDENYVDHQCLLVCPKEVDATEHLKKARELFGKAEVLQFSEGRWKGWPLGPNRAFITAATHIANNIPCAAWYWMEPDVVPLCYGWIQKLQRACVNPHKPFFGFYGATPGGTVYMAGCGVYPRDIRRRASNAWFCETTAFDIAIGPQISNYVTPLNGLLWNEGNTGGITELDGHFEDCDAIDRRIPKGAILFHKCKDASLIKLLEEQRQLRILRFTDGNISNPEIKKVLKPAARRREGYYKKQQQEKKALKIEQDQP
jgi:hypothetical protein